jgi:hypothetical protein
MTVCLEDEILLVTIWYIRSGTEQQAMNFTSAWGA